MAGHERSEQQMDAHQRIGQAIRASGAVIDLKQMVSLYAPLHEVEPYQGIAVRRDIAYGPNDRHRLDLFGLAGTGQRPILLFVHGGGYIAGDRRVRPGSPFYDNVALWAARHGFLAVNMSYRLAPDASWPAVQDDMALAIKWLIDNSPAFGGDPRSLVLMGHSAGATHIACFLAHPARWPGARARAAVLLSATLGASNDMQIEPDDAPFVGHERAYFGTDQGRYGTQGALPGLVECGISIMAVSPEFDPGFFKRHFDHLARIAPFGDTLHRTLALAGHNHMSQLFCLNTDDTLLGDAILDFVGQALDGASRPSAADVAPSTIDGARS
jgi:triacylglycerol lipase